MRKFTLLILSLTFASIANAKVVYLDNTKAQNASENLFSNFANAYAACTSPGDTIYVMGSNFNYGDIDISKQIVIIGPGYFLTDNDATQVNKLTANFDDINFFAGSEGSIIIGIVNSRDINTDMFIRTSDITVKNCYIYKAIGIYGNTSTDNNLSNITIDGCYFNEASSNYVGINRYTTNYSGLLLNLTVTNNIFRRSGMYVNPGSTGTISNNLFSGYFKPGTTSSFEIHNNIVLATNPEYIEIQNLPSISVSHNISVIDAFGSDNNNLAFVNENILFVGGDSRDGQYQLAAGSPAIGAGQGGTDIGPFGGPNPYRLSGLPYLPNIYEVSTGGYVIGNSLPVHIKAKQ